uniref:DUF4200 domain-containing protein n=2 Tax=Phaeomonas parva TaxID=124430 RepID=A0A6U4FML2_9STRA|mmetsp:Transcript_26517/g.82904  ORF Transcript_26517/g.82904 Transcript_26517/m.82904 type:complete len:325 (+) Transcript_26517:362-1336(+)
MRARGGMASLMPSLLLAMLLAAAAWPAAAASLLPPVAWPEAAAAGATKAVGNVVGFFKRPSRQSLRQYIEELEERLVELEVTRDALLENVRQMRGTQRNAATTNRDQALEIQQLRADYMEKQRKAVQKAVQNARKEQKEIDRVGFEAEKAEALRELEERLLEAKKKAMEELEEELEAVHRQRMEAMKAKFVKALEEAEAKLEATLLKAEKEKEAMLKASDTEQAKSRKSLQKAEAEKEAALNASDTARAKERKALVTAFTAKERSLKERIAKLDKEILQLKVAAEQGGRAMPSTPSTPLRKPTSGAIAGATAASRAWPTGNVSK